MTALILLAAVLVGYPMGYRQFAMMEQQFETTGNTLAQQVASSAVEPLFAEDNFNLERLINIILDQSDVVSVLIINRDLKLIGTESPRPEQQVMNQPEFFSTPGLLTDQNNITWFHTPIIFNGVTGGAAWVGLDKTPLINNQKLVITSAITAVSLLVLGIIWLAVRLSRALSKPIHELISASEALAHGDFSYRIKSSASGEFADVNKAFNDMAIGIEEKLKLEKNFSRFVSPSVAMHYMRRDESEISLQGERVEASIIFVDLVNYTGFSEQNPPEKVADILNFYFSEFSKACHQFQGNVDKFIGDCAMLVFGCPQADEDHRQHALDCAIYIRNRIHTLNSELKRNNQPYMEIRIGLAGGTVLAGLLGSAERLNYSVIGDAANLAARLCDKAPTGQILTDRDFILQLGESKKIHTHETQRISVKGFSQEIDTLVIDERDITLGLVD